MASIVNRPKGHKWIQFSLDGKRRSLKLGKRPRSFAETCKGYVLSILESKAIGAPLTQRTVEWLAGLDADTYKRFVSAGLVEPRSVTRLAAFVEKFVAAQKKKPRTIEMHELTGARLALHFGKDKDIRLITPADADGYAAWVRAEFADLTAARELRRVKQLFSTAVLWKSVDSNPFGHLKTHGRADQARRVYVSVETAQKVLAACANPRWRLIFALARFAGLRVPSEIATLTWKRVIVDEGVLMVEDVKRQTFRRVPIAPELRPHLDAVYFATKEGGATQVVDEVKLDKNLGTTMKKIIVGAGVVPWPKLFTNLRASCETDWFRKHPVHVVCAWIGHSPKVALEHYAMVTAADEVAAQEREATQDVEGSKTRSEESRAPANEVGDESPQPPSG